MVVEFTGLAFTSVGGPGTENNSIVYIKTRKFTLIPHASLSHMLQNYSDLQQCSVVLQSADHQFLVDTDTKRLQRKDLLFSDSFAEATWKRLHLQVSQLLWKVRKDSEIVEWSLHSHSKHIRNFQIRNYELAFQQGLSNLNSFLYIS